MKKLPLVLLVLFLSSCVSMTPPKNVPEEGNTLFIGRVIYQGSGIRNRAVNMNGKILENIKLTITHQGETFTVKTGGNGLFYFFGNSKNYYRITRFSIKKTGSNRAWSESSKGAYYTLLGAKEGVTNIGTFNWDVTNISSTVKRSEKHKEVMQLFKELFPDNIWSNERWTEIFPF